MKYIVEKIVTIEREVEADSVDEAITKAINRDYVTSYSPLGGGRL
jgi:hypothetical protein